jgi:hypothetical protein
MKEEEILKRREYVPLVKRRKKISPAKDHPWRRSWQEENVTSQNGNHRIGNTP